MMVVDVMPNSVSRNLFPVETLIRNQRQLFVRKAYAQGETGLVNSLEDASAH
jgi:hypothetical protein